MSAVDIAIEKYGEQIDSTIYSKLKDFEVDCIMCEWVMDIEKKSVTGSYRIDEAFLYIDLKRVGTVMGDHFQIERKSFFKNDYVISAIIKGNHLVYFTGGIIECIDHFKKIYI